MSRTWSAVLARLGVPTGDGRIIAPTGGSSRSLPLPLLYQPASSDGHGGSVVVGRIESLRIGDGMVTATGSMLDAAYGTDVMELLDAGVIGPSVDLDDIEYTMDDQERIVITQWRIAGATLVAIPAFADVSVTLDPMPMPDECDRPMYAPFTLDGMVFSVRSSGWADMPIADEGTAWDGDAAADRIFSWAGGPDNVSWSKYARGFLRKDDDADPETRGAYGFGIADVIDGTLTIVPRGVFAAAAAVQGARTGSAPEDAEGMKSVLRGLYKRMDRDAPFSLAKSLHKFEESPHSSAGNCRCGMAEQSAAHPHDFEAAYQGPGCTCSKPANDPIHAPGLLASASATVLPPIEWFYPPDLDRLTPLTVSDSGRVFGHIAGWDTCHVGLPGCVTPPRTGGEYSLFHVAEQETAQGPVLPVGTLVAGPTHCRDMQAGFQAAQQHYYDDPSAAVARVMAGEDEFGIWVAGWMLPNASEAAKQVFRSSPVSGDWRRVGGRLELIAVCSVNAPGFPVPRAKVAFSNGAQRALIAAGFTPVAGEWQDKPAETGKADDRARSLWAWAQTGMES